MKTLPYLFLGLFLCFSSVSAPHAEARSGGSVASVQKMVVVSGISMSILQPLEQLAQEGNVRFNTDNIWALIEQASPFHVPIFVVFLIGMFLVFFKLYELIADRRESKKIEAMDFRTMNVPQIVRAVSSQRESLITRLHAIMLNIYQSNRADIDLNNEIASYVDHQQDRFNTFKRRMDFLSDAAGAFGLLGTVWGILSVFSQGLLDDQMILSGMGIALITTILGLIVSIILNLSSTEIFSFFNKRLERVTEKSDELRFRLLELSITSEDTLREPLPQVTVPSGAAIAPVNRSLVPVVKENNEMANNKTVEQQPAKSIAQVEAVFEDRISNNSHGDSAAPAVRKPLVEASIEYPVEPHDLSFVNTATDGVVGKKLRNVRLLLVDNDGSPITEREIHVKVEEGGSVFSEGKKELTLQTDEQGEANFDIQIAKKAGKQLLAAHVPGSEAPRTRCAHTFLAKPGVPRKLKQFGNNQGGAAAEILGKALKVQVLDEFENPIPEWAVTFTIELGGGSFENGKNEVKVKTNNNGEGVVQLRVGKEPGFNTVKASVEGVVKELKFQAMSMA